MTGISSSNPLGWDDVYLVPTRDGSNTLFSRHFGATYHSQYGAVSESRHVFLQSGLYPLACRDSVHILEFGFGTGLNAFLAYLWSARQNIQLHYTGIELHPIAPFVAGKLDYPAYLSAGAGEDIFLRMHTESNFQINLFQFERLVSLEEISDSQKFDCIFFDAFAPDTHPAAWTPEVAAWLFRHTTESGNIVTYCARGEIRRQLKDAGFTMERLPGPPGKREMLRGTRLV